MLYQNLPDYRSRVRPQPLVERRPNVAALPLQQPPKQRHLPKKPLTTVFAVALLVVFIFYGSGAVHGVAHAFSSIGSSSIAQQEKEKAAKEAAAKAVRLEAFKSTVNSLIATHSDENVTVSTADLSTNNTMTLGDQGTFTAASTAKLITAIVLLHQVEQGRLTLDTYIDGQTADALLQNMIINSDNDAWQSLNDYLTHDALQAYTAQLGWKDYDPSVNTLLPSDMTLLAQKFYEGKLLNTADTQHLLSLMQQANKQEYIVDAVQSADPNLKVYHKAGWLDGLMHDVAIISNGKQSIVLAIYSYNSTADGDGSENQQLFKQITDAALKAYFPASSARTT